jgi:3-oxoacyl-[acyl-carrier protein] reductase
MSKLAGKVAVVTGASKGIGAAIAKSLASEGASVVVNYASSKSGADAVVADITAAGGRAVAVHGDVSKAAEAQGIIDSAVKNFGRLDILVNNSGVYEFSPIETFTEQHYTKIFNVNVLGVLLTTQAAVKHLSEGSSIINIGSVVSSLTPPNSAVYTGTKGAVDAITGVLAKELGPKKIRVNSINPGMVVLHCQRGEVPRLKRLQMGYRRANPRWRWSRLSALSTTCVQHRTLLNNQPNAKEEHSWGNSKER